MPKIFEDKVTYGSLSFNTGKSDSDGVDWYCDGLEGWDETVDPIVETAPAGYADGVTASEEFFLGPRYVEMQGVVVAPTRALAVKAWRAMVLVIHPNVERTVKRYGPFNEALTMRAATRITKTIDHGNAFRFVVTLIAPWPYKVGITSRTRSCGAFTGLDYRATYPRTYPRTYNGVELEGSTASSVTFVNQGNADALPTVKVTGPLTANAWTVTNVYTGKGFSFATDLTSGQVLTVDNKLRTAKLAGADVDYYIRGDWLRVPPGVACEFRLLTGASAPNAKLEITMADTWR